MSNGTIRMRATLDSVAAKKNGIVVQLMPDDYTTPEDFADLCRMRGKLVAVQIVDPDEPLPLEYDEDPGPDGGALALAE